MTDDWILIRDGGLGLRWVTDNHWELGVIGRIQTRGLGDLQNTDLLGISDKKWAVELGPTVTWRGWPIHVNWTTYAEPTDRHDGLTSEVALLWPTEWSRGYFVPSIAMKIQSDDYADYYYSVTPEEATPERSAYQAQANTTAEIKLRWGYAVSEKWLLTGTLTYEALGSEITDSPIIDEDHVWSAGLAFAYNADVFQSREYGGTTRFAERFEFRIGSFRDGIKTTVARDTVDGVPGFETDIEDILGASDTETVLQFDATMRLAHYHRLAVGYFEFGRDSTTTLEDDLEIGDTIFPAGTEVNTQVDFSALYAGYSYSLIRNTQLEIAVMAGIHFIDSKAEIRADSTDQRALSNASTPLPVIGLNASLALGEKALLSAKLQTFRTDYDRYEGSLNYATLDVQYRLGQNVSVGLGYNYYGMKLSSTEVNVNGHIKVRHQGPVAFFSIGY
jgi:outer membrane protein